MANRDEPTRQICCL